MSLAALNNDVSYRFVSTEQMNIGSLKLFMTPSTSTATTSSSSASSSSTYSYPSVLCAKPTLAFAGESIQGRVCLHAPRQIFVRGVWVKLSIVSTVTKSAAENITFDHLETEEEHAAGGMYDVLLGVCSDLTALEPSEQQRLASRQQRGSTTSEFVELRGGSERSNEYAWDFHFSLPAACPCSHIDAHAETLCWLTVVVDSPAVPRAASTLTHYITVLPGPLDEVASNDVRSPAISHATTREVVMQGDERERIWDISQWRTLGICGGRSKYSLSVSTSNSSGFAIKLAPCSRILLPVTCHLPRCLTNDRRYTVRLQLVRCCRYAGLAAVSAPLWVGLTEVCGGCTQSDFAVPVCVDPSHMLAALEQWPRPFFDHKESEREKEIAPCYSSSTALYSIDTMLVVELFKIGRKRPVSFAEQRLWLLPLPSRCFAETLITPRRALADVTNTSGVGSSRLLVNAQQRPPRIPSSLVEGLRKILTPVAKLAVPRVRAEAVSRGSAAILVDRTRYPPDDPSEVGGGNFAQLHRIADGSSVAVLSEAGTLCTPATPRTGAAHCAATPRTAIFYGYVHTPLQERERKNESERENENKTINSHIVREIFAHEPLTDSLC